MHFSDFIKELPNQDFFEKNKVLGFQGKEYPLLFFSLTFQRIEKIHTISVQKIVLHEVDQAAIKSQLSMSFLGQVQVYWFGNLAELDAKKKNAWLSYLTTYTGPHILLFFIDEVSDKQSTIIDMPLIVDEKMYDVVHNFLKPELVPQKKFSKKLFSSVEKVTLDTACLLLEYQAVVGLGADEFLDEWLEKLVPSEKSLFTLSQYFFAKSSKDFLNLWQEMRTVYPEVFWISFWSEQLWRAHYVVKFYQEKKIAEAKKISYRLPFSFIQKDWKKSNTTELRNAHQFIYDLDYKIKNGFSDIGLDLFYTKFFSGDFL
jgi:hypothetical protein